jgi:hypothetical protein
MSGFGNGMENKNDEGVHNKTKERNVQGELWKWNEKLK